jgi:hypothetical protein
MWHWGNSCTHRHHKTWQVFHYKAVESAKRSRPEICSKSQRMHSNSICTVLEYTVPLRHTIVLVQWYLMWNSKFKLSGEIFHKPYASFFLIISKIHPVGLCCSLMGYDTLQCYRWVPVFWRNTCPSGKGGSSKHWSLLRQSVVWKWSSVTSY